MIDYGTIKVGDKCKIVGMGAPGFAELGEIVTVTEVRKDRVDTVNARGAAAYFAPTCGASRLEFVSGVNHE